MKCKGWININECQNVLETCKLNNFTYSVQSTDLGIKLWTFDCGYPTVLKFSNFSATLNLREINFGWFQKVKDCYFNHFEGFEFWFLQKFHTWNVKSSQKFRVTQMVKITDFEASKGPKLISRKIWVTEKSLNFHIVLLISRNFWYKSVGVILRKI